MLLLAYGPGPMAAYLPDGPVAINLTDIYAARQGQGQRFKVPSDPRERWYVGVADAA